MLGRDPAARVGDRHHTGGFFPTLVGARGDLDPAARGARLDGVQDDVHQHLLHLRLVDRHEGQGRIAHAGDHHAAPARFRVEQAYDLSDELVQIGRFDLRGRRAGEGQEVVDEPADALDLAEREVTEGGAELLVAETLGQELDERADGDQGVADLVGDAGGERAERGEPVGAREQLVRPHQVGSELRVLEEQGRGLRHPTGEIHVRGRQGDTAPRREEEHARHAQTRAQGQRERPRSARRLRIRLARRKIRHTMRRDGDEEGSRAALEEERCPLETECPDDQLQERAGGAGNLRRQSTVPPPVAPAPRPRSPSCHHPIPSPRPPAGRCANLFGVVNARRQEVNSRGAATRRSRGPDGASG